MVKAAASIMDAEDKLLFLTERTAFNFENAMELVMSDLREQFDGTTINWRSVQIAFVNE